MFDELVTKVVVLLKLRPALCKQRQQDGGSIPQLLLRSIRDRDWSWLPKDLHRRPVS